ncbi:MAG: 30S ribosomal protein S4, partial [Erysipelothrix sp.]|nr:30S ribosomal protein S4 [Erysipelothrix sp.]
PVWKKSRRLSFSTLETGEELVRRNYAPGQHGPNQRRKKLSEYGLQLREKQRLRYMYGLNERQFHNTFVKVASREGVTGELFMIALESRLDNIVYRMGLATTRQAARQLVNHGHILVDGKKLDIPSYTVKVGQEIELKDRSKNLKIVNEALEARSSIVDFVEFDADTKKGKYIRLPERSELNSEIEEALVVEFYSK